MTQAYPNFESAEFLETHIQSTLDFYAPRVFAKEGGFHSSFLDDGTCTEPSARQLVGSARYVFNYAESYRRYGEAQHLEWAEWGLDFLRTAHSLWPRFRHTRRRRLSPHRHYGRRENAGRCLCIYGDLFLGRGG